MFGIPSSLTSPMRVPDADRSVREQERLISHLHLTSGSAVTSREVRDQQRRRMEDCCSANRHHCR